MIYHFNTLFSGGSIGRYYNQCCDIVPNDHDWICFWDGDVMTFHTFVNWNDFLEETIRHYPDIKLFSCVANRIGTHRQRVLPHQDDNPSMRHHRIISEKRFKAFGHSVRTDARTISGLMMLFRKSTWREAGFFTEDGIIGVDTRFSKSISDKGWKIGILDGLYVMHYYRLNEGNSNHLILK